MHFQKAVKPCSVQGISGCFFQKAVKPCLFTRPASGVEHPDGPERSGSFWYERSCFTRRFSCRLGYLVKKNAHPHGAAFVCERPIAARGGGEPLRRQAKWDTLI